MSRKQSVVRCYSYATKVSISPGKQNVTLSHPKFLPLEISLTPPPTNMQRARVHMLKSHVCSGVSRAGSNCISNVLRDLVETQFAPARAVKERGRRDVRVIRTRERFVSDGIAQEAIYRSAKTAYAI